jgi:hypothetical protein
MDAATLVAALDIMYVEEVTRSQFKAVCNPSMLVKQSALNAAIEAIRSNPGVRQATQTAKGDSVVIDIYITERPTDMQVATLFELLAPQFIFGTAGTTVVRDSEGKHRNTVQRIAVPRRSAEIVAVRACEIDEIVQFTTSDGCTDSQRVTTLCFTVKNPTRDSALNRATVIEIAGKLGVKLGNEKFKVEDNWIHASMKDCNLDGDPIDGTPSAA